MRWGVVVALGLAGVVLASCSARKPKSVTSEPGAVQEGIASWYGPGFHGRRTASGEIYNQYDLTAAHQTLRHGTRVRVTNLTNGRSVLVRINDRGPFVDDRIVDLSYAAARQIELIGPGTGPVRLEVLGPSEIDTTVQVADAAPPPAAVRPPVRVAPPPPPQSAPAVQPVSASRQAAEPVERPASRYAVQVAAFSSYERARRTQRLLESEGARTKLGLVEEAGMRYYRLRLGPFSRPDDASRTAARVIALGFPALVIADR